MRLRLLSILLHAYIGVRIAPALAAWPWAMALFSTVLTASALLVPMGLRAGSARGEGRSDRVAWAGFLCLGLFSSLFILTLGRDIGLLAAAGVLAVSPGAFDIRAWTTGSAVGVPIVGIAVTLWGLWNARRRPAVVNVDVPIAGLPAALDGFTIAQISDLHVGPTIKRPFVEAVVDRVNALQPDLIAVTGDLVDGSVAELGRHVAPLAGLASRHGTYFVTGNHEYYSGAAAWVAELRRLGMRVLMNEHAVLRHDGAPLVIAGVSDSSAHHFDVAQRSDPHGALAGAPSDASAKVLLAHQPRSALQAAGAGFDLQLSGHTHGGQFWPWNLFVRLQQPFTAGLHRMGALWVYTSRGTGYWGPPKRFGAPSEITRLRLVPAAPNAAA
jgi:predicted MPP superfamily phosphohydrolase